MLFPQLSLFLEVIGATLLAVMIVYAVRLNRRLATLQEDKTEFERLMMSFTDSTSRAESSVARLKASATDTAQALQESVTRAQALRDDLAFMVDRADELADRLEAAIREARPDQAVRAAEKTSGEKMGTEKSEPAAEEKTEAGSRKSKSDLLKALEGMR